MSNKLFRNIFLYSLDLVFIALSWFGAYYLRFNLDFNLISEDILNPAIRSSFLVLFCQLISFFVFRIHRVTWKYISIIDLKKIIKAVLVGEILSIVVLFFTRDLDEIPRSIFPIYTVLLFMIIIGSRVSVRLISDKQIKNKVNNKNKNLKNTLIVGAGMAAESLVRDMLRGRTEYLPCAFVDDDKNKYGKEIHGIKIIGDIESVDKALVEDLDLKYIFIAIPSATTEEMNRIHMICKKTNLPILTLPGLNQILDNKISIGQIRRLSIEDLLNRDPISLNWDEIKHNIQNKTILITGAGGSIGSEVCRQLINFNPSRLIMLDHAEYNLFKIEQEFKLNKSNIDKIEIKYFLADIKDKINMEYIFDLYKPDLVFHAAAYKHVPMLQDQIRTAVNNNILGTKILADAAIKNKVDKFILVSTDKAVNPENVMGKTKRAAEIICQNLNNKLDLNTKFITVRFGNVLDSAGSVVPIFKNQILNGGPVTVTHPDITRFFMLIPEAAQLILQSACLGKGGEIFVLDMGKSIKIVDLAHRMISLYGKTVGEDIEITYTGLRPGEKLYEELFYKNEEMLKTANNKIFQTSVNSRIDQDRVNNFVNKITDYIGKVLDRDNFVEDLTAELDNFVNLE